MNESETRDTRLLTAEKDAFALLAGGHGIQTALELLLSRVEDLAGHGLIASVWVVSEDGRRLSFCAGPRVPKAYRDAADESPVNARIGSCGKAIHSRQPVIVPDIAASELWTAHADLLTSVGIRASWSTPICSSLDEVLGTFAAYYPEPRAPSAEDVRLIRRVARTTTLLLERHRADEALRHSREHLQLLTDTVPVLISYVDTEARYRFCNRRYQEWFDLPIDHIVGQHMSAVLGETAWKIIGPRIEEALAGHVVEYEAEVAYSRGGTRWVHCVYTPHCNGQGQVTGVVVHVSDITASKRTQLALAASEERFRRLVEVGAAMVWTTDATGTPREDSPSWRAFTGYRLDQYLHSREWLNAYHPDDCHRVADTWRQAVVSHASFEIEARVRHADGQYRHLLSRALPLLNPDGTVRQWVGMKVDVTQRKAAEAALAESERMLREATEAAQVVAWDMDLRTGDVRCRGTAKAMWGMTEGSSDDFFDRIHPADRDTVRSRWSESLRTGGFAMEYRIIDPLGQTRWVYSRGNVLTGSDGKPTRSIGVSVDITERKRAEEETRRLAAIIGGTSDFVGIATLDGRLSYLNAAGRRMVGLSEDSDLAGYSHAALCPRWVYERTQQEWLPAALRDGFATGEGALLTLQGEEIPVSFVLLVHRNAQGQPESISTIARDIRDRKRVEDVVKANETLLQRIFDAATVGMCLVDEDLHFVTVNPEFAAICGYRQDELIGMDARALFASVQQTTIEEVIRHRLDGDHTPHLHTWEIVGRGDRRRIVKANSIRIDDRGGRPVVLKVVQDVTEQTRTERAIHQSRQRYANLVNSIEGIVWEVDVKTGLFTFVSPQAERILGYPLAAWFAPSFWEDHIHPEDRPTAAANRKNESRANLSEYRMLAADGRIVWIREVVSRMVDGQEPVCLRGILLDITGSKQAEEEIAKLNATVRHGLEELQTLMQVLPVGILLARDRSCTSITMNSAGAAMLRLPEGANASKTGLEAETLPFRVMKEGREIPHHDLPMQRAARTGQPVLGEETDILFSDGTVRNLYEYALPLYDEAGGVRGCVGVFVDMTDRKRAEQALRLSEERFRLATTAGKVGVWEWDIRADVVTWTESLFHIHGVTPGEMIMTSEGFSSLVHADDRRLVFDAIDAALTRGVPYELEFRALRPDGEMIWLYTNAVVLREGGLPVRMIGATVDITVSKRAADHLQAWNAELERKIGDRMQELEQSQERLRALATELNLAEQRERQRVAAELHDHLAQLLVLSRLKLGQAKRVDGVPPSCHGLLQQTEDVLSEALTYTRTLVADLSPPVLHEFGLVAALKWLSEYMRRYDLVVRVVTHMDEESINVPEDQAVLLFQSVRELLLNAHKHAGAEDATLRIVKEDSALHILVQDQGRGFDVSAPMSEGLERAAPSSQFGLFSIRERMRALGGAFHIESRPGEGTTARLILPVAWREEQRRHDRRTGQGPPLIPSSPAPRSSDPPVACHIRVLLVDDHAMVRQGLRSVLENYADVRIVGEAAHGEEAVKQVAALRPSVVVMDINMPRMNGIEATARIKTTYPDTVVVGLSVNAAGDNGDAMQAAGASMVLTKEAAVEQLYESIQQALKSMAD